MMNEQTQTTIFGILKLIPFAVVTAMIVLFWVDDFLGFLISLIFCWVTLPAIGFSIAFFIMGLRWRDVWQRIAVIWGGVNVLLVVVYVLAVAPDRRCNPDIMAKHYDKHHTEMEELHRYLQYDGIHQRLRKMGCIGIEYSQTTPNLVKIWFRRSGMGMYNYVINNRFMTDEEKSKVMGDYSLIPYNDHCVFEYAGGAIGSQTFSLEVKEDFLRKHKPW